MKTEPGDARQTRDGVQLSGMTTPSLPHARRLALLPVLALLGACGGEGGRSSRAAKSACGPATPALAQTAVIEYLKLQKDPYPQRFLVAAGTDSALPEQGMRALQDKGPTYFYPADTAQQRKVRLKLDSVGSYNTLLVAYKGFESGDTAATVRLSGTFIGGKHDGRTSPPRAMRFACDSTGWHYSKTEDAPQA